MDSIGIALRRMIFLVALAAGVGALISWRRSQSVTPVPSAPPEWPPLPIRSAVPAGETGWLPAHDDGTSPESHPIKVKASSGIFHVPGGRFYDRTRADRCYATAAAAEADGYRRSKS